MRVGNTYLRKKFILKILCALCLFRVVVCACIFGCNSSTSDEILILLPGTVKGKPIILAETSASNVFIIDLVPTYISRVWWNKDIIITENNLVRNRNSYPKDTTFFVERSKYCWYLIHPQTDLVLRVDDIISLKKKISEYGIDFQTVNLKELHVAQRERERARV